MYIQFQVNTDGQVYTYMLVLVKYLLFGPHKDSSAMSKQLLGHVRLAFQAVLYNEGIPATYIRTYTVSDYVLYRSLKNDITV